MEKYLIGSKLLNLKNNNDTDYLILVDASNDEGFYKYDKQGDIENHYRTASMLLKTLNFELPIDRTSIKYFVVQYQLDKDIIGQDFPYPHSVLEYRSNYIDVLNYIIDNQTVGFKKSPRLNDGNCSKGVYHIAYLTFILENNSTALTVDQKAIIQKIHDREMPQSYLDELEEKIRNLK